MYSSPMPADFARVENQPLHILTIQNSNPLFCLSYLDGLSEPVEKYTAILPISHFYQ